MRDEAKAVLFIPHLSSFTPHHHVPSSNAWKETAEDAAPDFRAALVSSCWPDGLAGLEGHTSAAPGLSRRA